MTPEQWAKSHREWLDYVDRAYESPGHPNFSTVPTELDPRLSPFAAQHFVDTAFRTDMPEHDGYWNTNLMVDFENSSPEVNPRTGRVIGEQEPIGAAQDRFQEAAGRPLWTAAAESFAEGNLDAVWEKLAGDSQVKRDDRVGEGTWSKKDSKVLLDNAARIASIAANPTSLATQIATLPLTGPLLGKYHEYVEPWLEATGVYPDNLKDITRKAEKEARKKAEIIDRNPSDVNPRVGYDPILDQRYFQERTTVNPSITVDQTIKAAEEREAAVREAEQERVAEERRVAEQQAYDAQIAQAAAQAQAAAEAARVEEAAQRASTPAGAQDIRSQVDTFTSIAPPPVVTEPILEIRTPEKRKRRRSKASRAQQQERDRVAKAKAERERVAIAEAAAAAQRAADIARWHDSAAYQMGGQSFPGGGVTYGGIGMAPDGGDTDYGGSYAGMGGFEGYR